MDSFDDNNTRWHEPEKPTGVGLILTHGASGNADAPMLQLLAKACAEAGALVVRFNLPFRQKRPNGPPHPSGAARDRQGLQDLANALREKGATEVVLSGHSYGGRQASILASEQPAVAERILLFSYPLHPPGRPDQLRTQHFASIQMPALFVSGTKDAFGSPEELTREIAAIPAAELYLVDGAGHDLRKGKFDLTKVLAFVNGAKT